LLNYSADRFERIELTEEAMALADTYIKEQVVGKTSTEDCRHIALATINKVDVLASWNFKHIVNLVKDKRIQFCKFTIRLSDDRNQKSKRPYQLWRRLKRKRHLMQ
jgi:hypothetical protein